MKEPRAGYKLAWDSLRNASVTMMLYPRLWIAKILDRPKINNTQGLQTFADTLYIDTVRFNKRLILYMKEFYSFFFLGKGGGILIQQTVFFQLN